MHTIFYAYETEIAHENFCETAQLSVSISCKLIHKHTNYSCIRRVFHYADAYPCKCCIERDASVAQTSLGFFGFRDAAFW